VNQPSIDRELWSPDRLRRHGRTKDEYAFETQSPTDPPMVVEVEGLHRDFLERLWKLMLICEKIKRTIRGRARVIIENAPCHFATIDSEAPIRHLLAMARVKEWNRFQCVWIPNDLLLGSLGQCRVMAGMRGGRTIVEEDGLWFDGTDGSPVFVSVRLGREWMGKGLGFLGH
jgi:hypothetical protein